ncbi:MAG: YggS family pyridoxal phosphate-dependent enzyme [Saprospiraceae bacterium]|nr:YggS family pyridoxal phosphate-dependent enzyme [Saprospiraceae bacterium]
MYQEILKQLQPTHTKLVAVSKTKPLPAIQTLYEQGQRIFGESKAQELSGKFEALPKDIEWHMIGHLQRNKVKYIAPFVALIHSVDSARLLSEINKQGEKANRVIDCLLQFHIAEEASKFGFTAESAQALLSSAGFSDMKHIRIVGVMGMATYTEEHQQIRKEFQCLRSIFEQLKNQFFADAAFFQEISMGMSGDYLLAIEEGATMVRIGSLLFGKREYQSD